MRTTFFLAALCAAAVAFAQAPKGSIAGAVTNPNGSQAIGVTVNAKLAGSTATAKATTAAGGKYTLADLAPGSWDISVNVAALRGFEQKNVTVEAGKATALNIHLEEGTQMSTLGEDTLAAMAHAKRHNAPTGPTPRTAEGKPDFSGVWWQPVVTDPGKPEWLPKAIEIARERTENNRKDSPQAHCLPSAIVRARPLHQFVQSKDFLVEMFDDDSPGFHQIYLDGRKHPKEPDYLWYGDSLGHWEGDTLVIDRVNFEEAVWLDQDSHPHSDKLHIIERYRRPDMGHLEQEVTVEDPGVLAKPWTFKRVAELGPAETIREFMCTENNRDLVHMVGK
ncbi:MAG: carboxypeptidase-like regulatory domain-containing protein [Bryobacteraceae bacterium]